MITLKLKIGKSVLECTAENMKSIHKFSSIYGALPSKCDACSSEDLYLNWRKVKKNNDTYNYFMITCKICLAELSLHEKKEGGFYVKAGEVMEVYRAPETIESVSTESSESDEVPF